MRVLATVTGIFLIDPRTCSAALFLPCCRFGMSGGSLYQGSPLVHGALAHSTCNPTWPPASRTQGPGLMLGDRGAVLCVGISGVLAAGAKTVVWVWVSAAMPFLQTRCGMIGTGKRPCYGHSPPPLFIRGGCCMAGYTATLPCRKTPKRERGSTGKGRCYTPPPLGGF